jgi:integrase
MRLGEVLRFDPSKDIEGGAIRVRDKTAGYSDRLIPILPELTPHLDQFPMNKAGWRNVYRGWLRARKKAGLEIRYHDLRHMAATAMVNAGFPDRIVADILGHKSTATTRKYTHPSMEAKREALKAITSGFHQAPAKQAKKAA